ncbi:MAG TPA: NAD(P)/FAD-dependent oxidoreductase [Kofleriaceae bacterium]|nr:NAD(P)/FAD-dependent oxidoreductase [Kofleriaceae bacterium]
MQLNVVGAGLVGPLLSLFLARRGYTVRVLEGRADPRLQRENGGRSINLTLATRGWKALSALGLAERVRPLTVPLYGRRIHHEDGTTSFQPYGQRGEEISSIRRADLNAVVLDAAESAAGVNIAFGQRCRRIDLEHNELELEDAAGVRTIERAQPVLACDGAFSIAHTTVRTPAGQQVFDVSRELASIGYKELRIPFAVGRLEHNAIHLWPRGGHVLIGFPNVDGSVSGSLFLPHSGPFPSFETLQTPDDVRRLFERDFADVLPLMPDLYDDFFTNPIGKLYTVRVSPWRVDGRLLLIGDSAHAMVPFLGQGLNCGFEDCVTLAACFDRHPRGDWRAIFGEFEQRRKADCDAVTELALRHYRELSEWVNDPEFLRRKAIEQRLYNDYAGRLIPLYSLISFTDMPYRTVHEHARRMDAVVDDLAGIDQLEARWDTAQVRAIIDGLLKTLPTAA